MTRAFRFIAVAAVVLATVPVVAARTRRGPTSPRSGRLHHTAKAQPAGPRGMDVARATEIQGALIKAGYMQGEPTGHWDATSEAAMQKLQSDNGWQTKLVPDSRALIKLGLGPNDERASNATSASVQP